VCGVEHGEEIQEGKAQRLGAHEEKDEEDDAGRQMRPPSLSRIRAATLQIRASRHNQLPNKGRIKRII
jgi:hypothetical protein